MFRRVYLDNSATTPVDPRVVEAMMPFLTESYGNTSSIHYFGQEARTAVDAARQSVARLINARPNEVIFTSGGTESNNLAIRGLVEANEHYGRHIVTSNIEHSAVKNVCADLEKRGYEVTYVPVCPEGIVSVDDIRSAIRDETVLITVMTANNEIGTLQPVAEIGSLVKELRDSGRKIWFHTDAVQAVGKIPVDVNVIGCDLVSLSGHKLYAPKGIGALYIKRSVRLHPQNIGGHQERNRRGGTESVPLIAALGKAFELAAAEMENEAVRQKHLRDDLENRLADAVPNIIFNGNRDQRIPNISNISFLGTEGEALLINLDMQGVAVSTGSACSSGTLEPSPVIRALNEDDNRARSALRISLGRFNTSADIDRIVEVLPAAVETLRKLGSSA
ncbi:MAG: cysteine desulfurase [Acidobacteriota bacterium]|nr:MAG: cysteine desulfurase [Acidobacteriota bacterium]